MVLLARAAGTARVPPLIRLPSDEVTMLATWQTAQPISEKRFLPLIASVVAARAASGGGALVARMNAAKASTSSPSSSGSGTASNAATERPLEVSSAGWNGLVIPISARYAV